MRVINDSMTPSRPVLINLSYTESYVISCHEKEQKYLLGKQVSRHLLLRIKGFDS